MIRLFYSNVWSVVDNNNTCIWSKERKSVIVNSSVFIPYPNDCFFWCENFYNLIGSFSKSEFPTLSFVFDEDSIARFQNQWFSISVIVFLWD